jgi:ABC-type Zn2+ transport system substrate-binding protein/surface adhesin
VIGNPGVEISAQEVIESTGVNVIFAEPQFSTEVPSVFVQENGDVIGELLTDAFAGKVTIDVELMKFNRDSLVQHLGG